MKKILAALVILPLAVFGGVKAYAWYQVKQSVDQIVVAARPFATITYGGIGTSLSGRVSVKDVNIVSPMIAADLAIEEVAISAPDLPTLLSMERKFKLNEVPERIGVEVKHLRIPIEVLASLEASKSDAEKAMDAAYAVGCGDIERIGLDEMVEMGYTSFDVSLRSSVERTGVGNAVKTVTELDWHDGGMITLVARVPDARAMGRLMAAEIPPSISIHIDSARFHEKLIAFCAGKAGMDTEPYVDHHVALIKERLQGSGVELSDSLYSAYQRYLGDGEPIAISFNPADMASVANLANYSPEDIPAVLGLELRVNDEVIDYDIGWNEKQNAAAVAEKPVEQDRQERAEKVAPAPRGYVLVDKATLGEHLNGTVRVETVTGRRLTGRLLGATEKSIQMRVRLGGGAATIPIRLNDIDSVQVYR